MINSQRDAFMRYRFGQKPMGGAVIKWQASDTFLLNMGGLTPGRSHIKRNSNVRINGRKLWIE